MFLTDADITQLKKLLHDALLAEWKAQGHYMSGKIVEEIDYLVERDFGRVSIIGSMYPYGLIQETGVSASNIPFSPGSGAKKSKYIDALVNWVQKRMAINDLKTAKSVAFAIAQTHKKQGMPTQRSYQYSSTGKRTEWINDALSKNVDKIGIYIAQFFNQYMIAEFETAVNKHIKVI